MSSGSEYDFYKKLKQDNGRLDENERLSEKELRQRAREAARELQLLNKTRQAEERDEILPEELLDRDTRPDDIKRLDREENTSFAKHLFNK